MSAVARLSSALRSSFRIVRQADARGLVLIVGCQVFLAVATAAQLFALREVVSRLDAGATSTSDLAWPIAALMGTVASMAVVSVGLRELRLVVNEAVERDATLTALDAAGRASLAQFEEAGFHDLLRRATRNIGGRVWAAVWSAVAFASGILTIASLAAALVFLAPVVFVVALFSAVPGLIVARKNSRTLYSFNYDYTSEDRRRQALERTVLDRRTAAELRSLGAIPRLIERIADLFGERVERIRAIARTRARWSIAAALVGAALATLAVWVLVSRIVSGQLELADGLVAFVALQQITVRARSLSQVASDLDEAGLYLADYSEFIRTNSDPAGGGGKRRPPASVAAERLGFTYPGTEAVVLRDAHIAIGPGQFVALVGENGSGKSTLAKLLAGLYEPDRGRVTWDGKEVNAKDLRASTAFMFQDFARFPLSVHDNVSLGPDVVATDRIDAALTATGLGELVAGLPHGTETILSREFSGGAELSGGEWQRIALARTLFRSAPLVILDEPSSSLDPRREAELLSTMKELHRDSAVLYISHRFSTVRAADLIFVLDEGRIVDHGSHDELMERGGLYAELFTIQAESYS